MTPRCPSRLEMKSSSYVYDPLVVAVQGDGTATLQEHRFASGAPDYDIANKTVATGAPAAHQLTELTDVLFGEEKGTRASAHPVKTPALAH